MDIQQLKDRCNLKYASAIDGMEYLYTFLTEKG